MAVLEIGGDIDTVDHFLDDLFIYRLLSVDALLAFTSGFVLIDLDAICKKTPLILCTIPLEKRQRILCGLRSDELNGVQVKVFAREDVD